MARRSNRGRTASIPDPARITGSMTLFSRVTVPFSRLIAGYNDPTRHTQPVTLSHIHFFTLLGFAAFLAQLAPRHRPDQQPASGSRRDMSPIDRQDSPNRTRTKSDQPVFARARIRETPSSTNASANQASVVPPPEPDDVAPARLTVSVAAWLVTLPTSLLTTTT